MSGLEDALGTTVADIVCHKMLNEQSQARSLKGRILGGHRTGVKVIPEIKSASPDHGVLRVIGRKTLVDIVESMESGGASAISVLVEPRRFHGSLEALELVREFTDLPILAKGFHFEPLHLARCRAAGADAFLQMVRVVDATGGDQRRFLELGAQLGMEALVEANNREELARALDAGAEVVAVNNRMIYDDLELDLQRASMGKGIPEGAAFVSASGINGPADLQEVYRHSGGRVDAILVGSSVMRSRDIAGHIRGLAAAGSEVVP